MRGRSRHAQRGAVAIAIIMALVLLQVMIVAGVVAGARWQDATVARVSSARAFYAAEAGLNMAIREMMLGTDEDADGRVGSISDDGDDLNDPSIGGASFRVRVSSAGSVTTLTSEGRSGDTSRELTATLSE